mgnify:CR=1 FL=1
MIRSYTVLTTYRRCPRLYAFTNLLGYSPIATPEAMECGQFVHAAIADHFRGFNWLETIIREEKRVLDRLQLIRDETKRIKAMESTAKASQRAQQLTARYTEHWARDYKAVLTETEIRLDGVIAHPDLVALYDDGRSKHRVVVDFKTSKSPDLRFYDLSGQVDLYSFLTDYNIDLVIYDVISEEGIYRHVRPPRLIDGAKLFACIKKLPDDTDLCLVLPYPAFDCPQQCAFWEACYLLETDNREACFDYLRANYVHEE